MTNTEMIEIGRKDIGDKFNIIFTKAASGEAISELRLQAHHKNAYGIPYGGVLFGLADNTAGMAFLSAGGNGVTASGHVNFLRGTKKTEKLICKAKVVKTGKKLFFVDAYVEDDNGTILCEFNFIFSNLT